VVWQSRAKKREVEARGGNEKLTFWLKL